MAFNLGNFKSRDIPGFKAILTKWPTTPVKVYLEDLPAGEGSHFVSHTLLEQEWVFNLELTGKTFNSVYGNMYKISEALNPSKGLQDFTREEAPGWVWSGIVSKEIQWSRDKTLWAGQFGYCKVTAQLTILTPDPYGYRHGGDAELSHSGLLVLTNPLSNAIIYPKMAYRGILSGTQSISIGEMKIKGPLAANEYMLIDFVTENFAIYRGDYKTLSGVKVANIAHRIINYKRPIIPQQGEIQLPVASESSDFRFYAQLKSRLI